MQGNRSFLLRSHFSKSRFDTSSSNKTAEDVLRFLKVGRYSFSRSIPPKFERKLRRHKQRFGKIDTTVVLDKDENLL